MYGRVCRVVSALPPTLLIHLARSAGLSDSAWGSLSGLCDIVMRSRLPLDSKPIIIGRLALSRPLSRILHRLRRAYLLEGVNP